MTDKTVATEYACIDQPQTKRGQERRFALLISAYTLFVEKGYESVSLDDIVNHAGGSKTSIYKYFGNKEGLFQAICEYRRELFYQDICQNFSQSQDLRQYLVRTLFNFYQHISKPENMAFLRLVIDQTKDNPELAQFLHEKGPQHVQTTIACALAKAHDKGTLYCPNPESSAIMYFGIIRNYEWRAIMGLDIAEPEQETIKHIEYCVDRFLQGHQKH